MCGVFSAIQNLKIKQALILMPLAVLCCSLCANAQGNGEQVTYPFLKLDFGPSHNAAVTQEGFTAMTAADSGIVIDGITIEIGTRQAGETIQQRDRGAKPPPRFTNFDSVRICFSPRPSWLADSSKLGGCLNLAYATLMAFCRCYL